MESGAERMSELKDKVLHWLANGRVGLSSKCLAMTTAGTRCEPDYPHDPDDLNRCLLLMEHIPEVRETLPKMAKVSREWMGLADHWDEIETAFLEEVGLDWSHGLSAPKTYNLMQRAMGRTR